MWCLPTTPSPDPSHLLKQHQIRTRRYFSCCAFLWNSQQNTPSLPVCFFTVAKPTHHSNTPRGPSHVSPRERAMECSAQSGTRSPAKQNPIFHNPPPSLSRNPILIYLVSFLSTTGPNFDVSNTRHRDTQRWEKSNAAFSATEISSSKATQKLETLHWVFQHLSELPVGWRLILYAYSLH